jgi:hypothetical protein
VLAWDGDHLERPLWSLAVSALDLLRSGPLEHPKACEGCPWLFLDTIRNHSRRWWAMDDCGSRGKVRRHRARYGRSLNATFERYRAAARRGTPAPTVHRALDAPDEHPDQLIVGEPSGSTHSAPAEGRATRRTASSKSSRRSPSWRSTSTRPFGTGSEIHPSGLPLRYASR